MWSLFVVPRKPRQEGSVALVGIGVGGGVGPLPQERLDEAFGLAVRSRTIRSCSPVAGVMLLIDSSGQVAGKALAVVGEDPSDRRSQEAHGTERPVDEVGRTSLGLIGVDARQRQWAVVVHGDKEVVEPGSRAAAVGSRAGGTVPRRTEPCQLLDVHMQHISGSAMFIAVIRLRWIKRPQARQPRSLHDARHGCSGYAKLGGDGPDCSPLSPEANSL